MFNLYPERGGKMLVVKGKIGDKTVDVIRDTGCSGIVVKKELVRDGTRIFHSGSSNPRLVKLGSQAFWVGPKILASWRPCSLLL